MLKSGSEVCTIVIGSLFCCLCSRYDYSVCADRAKKFYPEIRKYYPALKDESLEPGYAGIRPKLSGPKQASVDFLIQVFSHSFNY